MEKFLVIDGNSILNRAFYGLGAARMVTAEGLHTNAIFGFLNIYYMIMEKFEPNYVAVAFDLKAPTFRHKMFADYKGTRKGMPDELREQVPIIKDVLRAMNVKIFEMAGYEADDILGTIASLNDNNLSKDIHTYILTGDRDSYQLISQKTSIIFPSNKGSKTDYTVYTPELLKEEKNIEPYQVVDVKSLMGDASDNIPGVKGIGEKTAYTLIEKYTTMENIYANIDTLDASPKIIEKLKADKDMASMSYTLATINRNVPLEYTLEDVVVKEINKEALFPLFKKLAFNKFLSKYDFDGVSEEITKKSAQKSEINMEDKNIVVVDSRNITEHINRIDKLFSKEEVSYLLNINNDEYFTPTLKISDHNLLVLYDKTTDMCYIINIDDIEKQDTSIIKNILIKLATSKATKVGYNVKQDIRYIFTNLSSKIEKFDYDLLVACYLLDSTRNFKFESILEELFGVIINVEDNKKEVQLSFFEEIQDESENSKNTIDNNLAKNLALSVKGISYSKDIMEEKLKADGMYELFKDIEMPLCETLASMETTGMYVDKSKLDDFDKIISARLEELEKKIYMLADEEFNINSPQQLGIILFEKLNLPGKKKTKTGYSTNKEVLESLEEYHEIIPLLIEYRQTMKLKSTYVDGLIPKIKEDSRIHTTFTQTVTSTGRLSSIEPNLQNIPIRLELGSKIRTFFTAPAGRKIMDADYSQIELRVLSHISKDEVMQSAFNNGIDVHKVTASQVFDVPLDEVTKAMRSKAKAVNFGIVYGISEFGLAKNIGTSWREAKDYMEKYLEKYSGIHGFMTDIVKEAKEKGYVTTLYGRRRYIPELKNKNKNMVQFGERVAMNTPIQGTAADIIKIAMNRLYKALKENDLKSKLVMQVHDELIVETYEEEIEIVEKLMRESMENVIKLDIPLDIDLNIGQSWYDAK